MSPDLRENLEVEVLCSRFEQLKEIVKKMLHQMGQLRNKQPGLFCIIVCSASMLIWLSDYVLNGMLLKYVFFMLILLAPIVVIYLPVRRLPARPPPSNRRESDSEIEEFLPAATETNIQILTKAGEVGEYSPTPTSAVTEAPKEQEEQEFLNDGDLAGHKMPSHEDGSSDGLELSDLELSEKSSTSSRSSQSDSEFEIIDRQEIGKLCTPQNST
ncbi:PREDICTED: uncharacterized protein LOC106742873 [Dinoponera quadriceps]|uniref:Uncharacterized protein LOC106742873 n=1 Tax=Dinoponera quadriceps TaxID=609295 RepID=A0A6P3X070_DINQU|nr:PREDICTED: uncharacterized protein LOC106742873 [Dinoponera quadriceps]